MATAGEVNYGGNIGQGEAQVYQEKVSPFLAFAAAQDQRRANNQIQQDRYSQQFQQKRNADIEKYVNDNIGSNPGWFQQENSVKELNDVRSKARQFAYDNPHADVKTVGMMFGEDKDAALRRIGKRNQIQKEIETLRSGTNNPNQSYDAQWVNAQANKAFDADVDNIGSGEIIGLANHPRAYDADKGIIKSVKDITSQTQYTGTGAPQDIGFGMQIDGWTKKVRFKTDTKGNIQDETVDYVLDADPQVSQRLRWDYARKMAGVQDDTYATPEQMKTIQDNFNRIQFSDSPEVVRYVRSGVRNSLNQLQRYEYIDRKKIQNYPGGSGKQPSSDDLTDRVMTLNHLTKPFNGQGEPTPEAKQALNRLMTGKNLGGRPITGIEFEKGGRALTKEQMEELGNVIAESGGHQKGATAINNWMKEQQAKDKNFKMSRPDAVNLTIKVGSDPYSDNPQDKVLEKPISIDLSEPGAKALLNQILNTSEGEKKILYKDLLNFEKTGKKPGLDLTGDGTEDSNFVLDLTQ